MIRIRLDLTPLKEQARALHLAPERLQVRLQDALLTAVEDEASTVAAATPRGLVVRTADGLHVHMADRWSATDHGDHVSLDNPADYAGYVAKEPADAYGSRVEAHYNRQLRAALDAAPDHIHDTLAVRLPTLLDGEI